jgi:PAS domain S-box-containing protein
MDKLRTTFKNLFSAPTFADEEQTRLARIVHVLYAGLVLVSLLAVFVDKAPSTIRILFIANVFALASYVLNRRGFPRAGGVILLLIFLTAITAFLLAGNGIHDIAITGLPVLLIMSALILERRGVIAFTALVIATTGLVVYAGTFSVFGINISTPDTLTPLASFFVISAILGIAALASHILIDQLVKSVARSRVSEARMLSLVENSPDFILEIDRAGKILFINKLSETYLGRNVRDILPPDQLEYGLEVIEKAFISDKPLTAELHTVIPSGQVVWDSIRLGQIRNGNIVTSLTVVMTDITAQKSIEANMSRSEELYRSAIEAANAIPYYLNYKERTYDFIGNGILELTGYAPGEINQDIYISLIVDGYFVGEAAKYDRGEAGEHARRGDIAIWQNIHLLKKRNGEERWVLDSAVQVKNEQDENIGSIGILQDITERKQNEIERENLVTELQNRNAELERFTYTVSHELKSPIVTTKAYLGSIERDLNNGNFDRAKKDLLRIATATDKMHKTLTDLLELSRIGRIINSPEEFDLVQLTYTTLEALDSQLRAKNISVHVSPHLPTLYGDHIRIGEVMENLITNAAKYMTGQSDPLIEIGTRIENGEQIIYVKDNGIGIEAQYLQKIFGLFDKLDPTSEGTGIGLALIKRIVEVHGGRIWAESDGPGKGSTFCFTIPDERKE